MKIKIDGSRCVSCRKYTQYYAVDTATGAFEPINCGFCGDKQRTTRPGNRCRGYREKGNVMVSTTSR